jgi:7,8-dihydroneopterin aldolase/epimerase/oxygenase
LVIIHLKQLRVYAYHGVYAEERTVGSEYEVNADLYFEAAGKITELEQTLNYAEAVALVKTRMQEPTPLLETVAGDLAEKMKILFPQLQRAVVQVLKLQAPLAQFEGLVGVTVDKSF